MPNFTSSSCLIETHQRLFSETLEIFESYYDFIRHSDIWQLNDLPNLASQKFGSVKFNLAVLALKAFGDDFRFLVSLVP